LAFEEEAPTYIIPEDELILSHIETRINNAFAMCRKAIDLAREGNIMGAKLLYNDCLTLLHGIEDMLRGYEKATRITIPLETNVLRNIYEAIVGLSPAELRETEIEEEAEILRQLATLAKTEMKAEKRSPPPGWKPEITKEEMKERKRKK
jgi:hypothetical protein